MRFLLAALLSFFLLAGTASASIHVSPSGDDASCRPDSDPRGEVYCATPGRGLQVVEPGKTVYCLPDNGKSTGLGGIYPSVTVSRAFTAGTTLRGGDCNVAGLTFAPTSARVTVMGVNVHGNTVLAGDFNTLTGIEATNPEHTCIRIRGGSQHPAQRPIVTGSDIHGCRRAIDTPYTGSATANTAGDDVLNPSVMNNHIHDAIEDAIAVGDWTNGVIQGNTIGDIQDPTGVIHNDGIQFFGGMDGIQVLDNVIQDEDGNGISSDSQGMLLQTTGSNEPNTNIVVARNTIHDVPGVGIQVDASGALTVADNTVCSGTAPGINGGALWIWRKVAGAPVAVRNNVLSAPWSRKGTGPDYVVVEDTNNTSPCP